MTVVETRKRALILGISNERSIAMATLEAMVEAGFDVIATTVPNPSIWAKATKALGADFPLYSLDVAGSDDDILKLAETVKERWPDGFDYLVHAIAFSDKDELKGSIFNTSRENYLRTQDISAYSLLAVCKHLGPLMRPGGGVSAYTFAASRFRSPNYNTMAMAKAALETLIKYIAFEPLFGGRNIKVIGISAGPVPTLSAMGVHGFRESMKIAAERSATGANVTADIVGQATLMLLQTPGITGSVHDVDNGVVHAGMGAGDGEYAFYAKALGPYHKELEAAAKASVTAMENPSAGTEI